MAKKHQVVRYLLANTDRDDDNNENKKNNEGDFATLRVCCGTLRGYIRTTGSQ